MKIQKLNKPKYRFTPISISFCSVPKLRNKNIYLTVNKTSAVGKSFSTNHPKCSINTNCFIKILDKRRFKKLNANNRRYLNIKTNMKKHPIYGRGVTPVIFYMGDSPY